MGNINYNMVAHVADAIKQANSRPMLNALVAYALSFERRCGLRWFYRYHLYHKRIDALIIDRRVSGV